MPARALWKGVIELGQMNVPVKLYTAVRNQEIRFSMLHDQDGVPIRQVLECPREHKEVPREHVVRGFELTREQYVIVGDEDLEKCAPVPSRTIAIRQFVRPTDIDPMYYIKPYYLGPDKGGEKGYALLAAAMEKSKKVALAEFVMRGKEYLSTIRPLDGALCLTTMLYADEVIPPEEVEEEEGLGEGAKLNERELKMAEQLVGSLATHFDPTKYHDEYRACVMKMIEKKAAGERIEIEPAPKPKATRGQDLTEALRASLAQVKQQRRKSA